MVTLRPVQFQIVPVVVADDGTNLTPVEVAPIVIAASELDGFAASFRAQLAEEQVKLNPAEEGDSPRP